MENIINNPGLQHLAENIFLNLNYEDLKKCKLINQSTKEILENPMFWIKKLIPKENQKDWIKVIESEKNSEKETAIMSYLLWNLEKEDLVDLPCYTSPDVQDDFRKIIMECCEKWGLSDEDTEIVKILAPLTENPNAPDRYGNIPIY